MQDDVAKINAGNENDEYFDLPSVTDCNIFCLNKICFEKDMLPPKF